MTQYSTIGLLYFIAFMNISTISGLTCYKCVGLKGRGTACQNNVNSEQIVCFDSQGLGSPEQCVLYENRPPYSSDVWIRRGCHTSCEQLKVSDVYKDYTFISCYTCNTSLCNSMPIYSPPPQNKRRDNKRQYYETENDNNTLCNKASLLLILALLLLLTIFK